MKKKSNIYIVIIVLVAIILFAPIPTGRMKDGGSRQYSALTYKIILWNRIIGENEFYKKTRIYWFPDNFKSIDDLWKSENVSEPDNTITDFSLVLQTFGNKGLTFIINNETNRVFTYGEDYKLLYLKNDSWVNLPYIIEKWGFNNISYSIVPNSITNKIAVDWVWLYGELPDGLYKFEKTVKSSGDNNNYIVSEEFEIVNGEPVKVSSYTLSKCDKYNKVLASIILTNESDMEIISRAYFNAIVKSTMVEIDLAKVIDFYYVETKYSNGEMSNAVFCFKNGNAYMISAKEEGTSNSMRLALPVQNELYQKMIDLLN